MLYSCRLSLPIIDIWAQAGKYALLKGFGVILVAVETNRNALLKKEN
jgi:hypothetical protein